MTRVVSFGHTRAVQRHAAASHRANAAPACDVATDEEHGAAEALAAALDDLASTDDVIAPAYEQGARPGEPGAQVMVPHRLVAALARQAFAEAARH